MSIKPVNNGKNGLEKTSGVSYVTELQLYIYMGALVILDLFPSNFDYLLQGFIWLYMLEPNQFVKSDEDICVSYY